MQILLVNDDGIDAPGLMELERVLAESNYKVITVAPARQQSAKSQSLSFGTDLTLRQVSANRYALDGTPADCVVVALDYLLRDNRPDLVISGINDGENIGWEIHYSGTVGAAREAARYGIRSLAISMCEIKSVSSDLKKLEFNKAAVFMLPLLELLPSLEWRDRSLLNINIPRGDPEEWKASHVSMASFLQRRVATTTAAGDGDLQLRILVDATTTEKASAQDDIMTLAHRKVSLSFVEIDQSHARDLGTLQTFCTRLNSASLLVKSAVTEGIPQNEA